MREEGRDVAHRGGEGGVDPDRAMAGEVNTHSLTLGPGLSPQPTPDPRMLHLQGDTPNI